MRCPWCNGLTSRKDTQGFCTECERIFSPSAAEIKKSQEAIRLFLNAEHPRLLVRELNFHSLSKQDDEEEERKKLEYDIKKKLAKVN